MYILDTALDETKIAVCPSASARKCGIARAGARALPDRGTRTLQPSCASTSSLAVLGTQLDLTTLSDCARTPPQEEGRRVAARHACNSWCRTSSVSGMHYDRRTPAPSVQASVTSASSLNSQRDAGAPASTKVDSALLRSHISPEPTYGIEGPASGRGIQRLASSHIVLGHCLELLIIPRAHHIAGQ